MPVSTRLMWRRSATAVWRPRGRTLPSLASTRRRAPPLAVASACRAQPAAGRAAAAFPPAAVAPRRTSTHSWTTVPRPPTSVSRPCQPQLARRSRASPCRLSLTVAAASNDATLGNAPTRTALGKLKVAELRIELQSRGLPSSGLKAELVERLQAYWADWAEDAGASASTPSPAVPDSGSPRSHPPEATHEATPEEEEDSTPLTPDEEHEEALADAALDYAMSHAPQGHERAFEADGDTREQRATPGGTAGQGTEVERARRQLQNAQFRANKTSFDNVTGLELMFLGTSSGSPSNSRNVTSIVLRMLAKSWMIDCGEGTQHQLMYSPLKPSTFDKIFITHLHGDHIWGLPGMIATITHNRSEEMRDNKEPIEIFGPPGVFAFLEVSLSISQTHLLMPVIVHELYYPDMRQRGPPPDPKESSRWRNLFYHELYPQGGARPTPDRPKRTGDRGRLVGGHPNEGVWELCTEGEFRMVATHLVHRVEVFGYTMIEKDQKGHIDKDECTARGLPPGPLYKDLKNGLPVVLPDGVVLRPEEVVGPDLCGRKVVVLGDTCDPSGIAQVAKGADLLVHEATFDSSIPEKALVAGHSTATQAGEFARRIDAGRLVITHFSARYDVYSGVHAPNSLSIADLVNEAKAAYGRDDVIASADFMRIGVPRSTKAARLAQKRELRQGTVQTSSTKQDVAPKPKGLSRLRKLAAPVPR